MASVDLIGKPREQIGEGVRGFKGQALQEADECSDDEIDRVISHESTIFSAHDSSLVRRHLRPSVLARRYLSSSACRPGKPQRCPPRKLFPKFGGPRIFCQGEFDQLAGRLRLIDRQDDLDGVSPFFTADNGFPAGFQSFDEIYKLPGVSLMRDRLRIAGAAGRAGDIHVLFANS